MMHRNNQALVFFILAFSTTLAAAFQRIENNKILIRSSAPTMMQTLANIRGGGASEYSSPTGALEEGVDIVDAGAETDIMSQGLEEEIPVTPSVLNINAYVGAVSSMVGTLLSDYPVATYVGAAVLAVIVIYVITGLLSKSDAEVDRPIEAVTIDVTTVPAVGSFSNDGAKRRPKAVASYVVGVLGALAGSLIISAEQPKCGLTTRGSRAVGTKSSASSVEDEKDDTNDSYPHQDKIKAGGVALASSVGVRALLVGKLLSNWF